LYRTNLRGAVKKLPVVIAAVVFMTGCGQAGGGPAGPTPSQKTLFVYCAGGTPAYVIVEAPSSGCRELRAGVDYADGRVLIGFKESTSNADLQGALAAHQASVLSTPAPGQRLLQVPPGTVPDAVVGLARYPFITFAQPDLLQHPDQSTSSS
jgi:hypothetical protein